MVKLTLEDRAALIIGRLTLKDEANALVVDELRAELAAVKADKEQKSNDEVAGS